MKNSAISLGKRQLVDSIWKSAGIEGLGTTFPATKNIIENIPVETTPDEVLFIVNMKHAWEFLFENIDYPVNIAYLRELNRICMTDLLYAEDPGKIRDTVVGIGGTSWKPELPNTAVIMEDIEKIQNNPDKREAALDMFCYIARTQMFLDGNKRVSQLACNKILMENNIGILSVPYDRISDFTQHLLDFYESGNAEPFKDFLKETSFEYTKEYKQKHPELTGYDKKKEFHRRFIMIAGIPGAGKHILAKEYLSEMPKAVYISTDEIRNKAGIENNSVFDVAKEQIKKALYDGRDIIYSASNLDYRERKAILDLMSGITDIKKEIAVAYKDPEKGDNGIDPDLRFNMAVRLHDNPPLPSEGWDEISLNGEDPFKGFVREKEVKTPDKNKAK